MTLSAKIASLLLIALLTTLACNTSAPTQEALKAEVVSALDALATELADERPADAAAYTERLQACLDANPAFYGSAAALLDDDGRVTASPCVYRTADGYATLDLAVPSAAAMYKVTSPLTVIPAQTVIPALHRHSRAGRHSRADRHSRAGGNP